MPPQVLQAVLVGFIDVGHSAVVDETHSVEPEADGLSLCPGGEDAHEAAPTSGLVLGLLVRGTQVGSPQLRVCTVVPLCQTLDELVVVLDALVEE